MIINPQLAHSFIKEIDLEKTFNLAIESLKMLKKKSGKGNDLLGWIDTERMISNSELERIITTAKIFQKYKTVIVIGIGGSYLGSKAVIDLFKPYFSNEKTEILFAGQNLDEEYIQELLLHLEDRDFGIVVISKSGTTLEPALAFRFLLKLLLRRVKESQLKDKVVAITDKNKGALRELANAYNLNTFVVPEDIGGRFSVLTAVGLLPIAIAGIDIKKLIESVKQSSVQFLKEDKQNPAIVYAAYRNLLYKNGFTNEIMVYTKPKWHAFAEWWKQLFAESEGKDNKGIFPISMSITTDLHSLGQYVQEGKRNLFETFICIQKQETGLKIDTVDRNYDKLNYLSGKTIHYINSKAEEGTMEAHFKGGVPVLKIEIEKLDVQTVGQLIFFYEMSCAISGYVLGVNPFDQPGVEEYKKNMFRLLGK